MQLNSIPTYLIQEWLFDKAEGKFEIDLGESGVQHQYLSNISYSNFEHMNYSLDIGNINLRSILAKYYNHPMENICITHGGQEALYLFYRSFLKSGDHVITFTPGWSQSWVIPKEIGCRVSTIPLKSSNNFELDINQIQKFISADTKLMVINYPHNPTGTNLSAETYQSLIDLCLQNNIFILNDEEYLHSYENSIVTKTTNSAAIGSLSKIYGFPATRIGWFVGPAKIVDQIVNYKRYVSVCNSNLCESLAVSILQQKDEHIARYQKLVSQGIQVLKNWIHQIPNFKLIQPKNTPYAYIILPDAWDSDQFCQEVLETQKVLLMPASVFGHKENAFRITFAREKHIINEGLNRILEYVNNQFPKRYNSENK